MHLLIRKENFVEEKKVEETQTKEILKVKGKTRMMIVLGFILLTSVVAYILFRAQYLEVLEIGEDYLKIYWQNIRYTLISMAINFVGVFFIIYWTNKRIHRGLKQFFNDEKKKMPKMLNKSIALIGATIISAIVSNTILNKAILCFNATSFGTNDPLFGHDIGYFMFQKPFIQFVAMYLLILVIGLTLYAGIYYIIAFNKYFDGINRETLKESILMKQLLHNVVVAGVLIGLVTLIQIEDLGVQRFMHLADGTSYAIYGAGFSDVSIKLWGYRFLSVLMVISIVCAIKFFKKKEARKVILSIAAVPAYLITLTIVLFICQVFFVNTNELDREKGFIYDNIKYTKNAYGINIDEVSLSDNETITSEDIENNKPVLDNMAMVSKELVLKDLNSSQTAKGYYTYENTQIGVYTVDGKEELVYITPREIYNSTGTYNNKTYEYTHGYGAIFTSASDLTQSGNLYHLQKEFAETNQSIKITEPRIYFGLQTNDTVVTNTTNKKEFDYPILDSKNADNAENTYEGEAGLKLNFIDRLIISIKEGDLKLAISNNITKESKILTNRNIIERAKAVMPYLLYDEEPYLVVNKEGKLIWVLDGYTTSNQYPYSQRTQVEYAGDKLELNYIRNSVKVLIDAYDGTTKFYITDKTDPIVMAYWKIYPDLFVDKDATLPEDIQEHIVYPEFLYNIQAQVITRYHNIQPDVLYRGDDVWQIATKTTTKTSSKTGSTFEPYYTMVKTKDSDREEVGLVIPYTPYEKQNIIAYMVGTYDGKNTLKLYKYAANSNVVGPMQLETQLEQNERISKEIETISVSGTKLIKNTIIVPIGDSLLYVEPMYQQKLNEGDTLLVLKKVVVASGSKVAIGDTLASALTRLVSQYAVDIEVEDTEDVDSLINAIIKANKNLEESTDTHNWEMMGKDVDKLQKLIRALEEIVEKEKKENKENDTTTDMQEYIHQLEANRIGNEIITE